MIYMSYIRFIETQTRRDKMIFKTLGQASSAVQLHGEKEACTVCKVPFNLYGIDYLYHYQNNKGVFVSKNIIDALHRGFKL